MEATLTLDIDLAALLSKINPATYGVDAIRQVFLGSGPAGAGLGVSVLGHTMSLVEGRARRGAWTCLPWRRGMALRPSGVTASAYFGGSAGRVR